MLSSIKQIECIAYSWVQREQAGLSDSESRELEAWLAQDIRHFETFDALKSTWDRFEDFSNDIVLEEPAPDLERFRPKSHRRFGILRAAWFVPLAAAAAVTVAFVLWMQPRSPGLAEKPLIALSPLAFPSLLEQRTLPDGSVVELNRDTEIEVSFSKAQRGIRLVRGEAHFSVAKDPSRPFVVEASGIQVRAVGTAFNVRMDSSAVEVTVAEGIVQVATPDRTVPRLEAGQATRLSLTEAETPKIERLTISQLEEKLLWQPKLLDFDDAALGDIVAEFNRRNPVALVILEDALRSRRMSATFRSDNIEGFVRLLETHFNVRAERQDDSSIALRRF
jgi:transmembrane sensor